KKCNNNLLSRLDAALVDFPPIALLRVQYVPYTKKGKLPKADFENATVERTHPRHQKWTAKADSKIITEETQLEDGWVAFKVNLEGKRNRHAGWALARAFNKITWGRAPLDRDRSMLVRIGSTPRGSSS